MGKSHHTLPRCPTGKVKYRTEQGALISNLDRPFLNAYQCPHCRYWHLTSQPRRR